MSLDSASRSREEERRRIAREGGCVAIIELGDRDGNGLGLTELRVRAAVRMELGESERLRVGVLKEGEREGTWGNTVNHQSRIAWWMRGPLECLPKAKK